MWPQCWDLQGPRELEQRDLRNLNLGDLKKGPNGGVSRTPQKKQKTRYNDIAMATWNVRTMVQRGKIQEIAQAMLRYIPKEEEEDLGCDG
jgi:hypothetical protein